MTEQTMPDPEVHDKWTNLRRWHAVELLGTHHDLSPSEVIIRYLSAMDSAHTDMYETTDAKKHFEECGQYYLPEAIELIEWLAKNGWTIVKAGKE